VWLWVCVGVCVWVCVSVCVCVCVCVCVSDSIFLLGLLPNEMLQCLITCKGFAVTKDAYLSNAPFQRRVLYKSFLQWSGE